MKRTFCLFFTMVLNFGANLIFAENFQQPQLPEDGFYDYRYSTWECGKMSAFYYKTGEDEWRVYVMGSDELPLAARIIKADWSTIIWVDRDRDGQFDEKYFDADKFVAKYPTPCDVVVK